MSDAGKRSFCAGYLAGIAGMPLASAPQQAFADGGAAMYSYNGRLLPALPSGYDSRPYATIMFTTSGATYLYLSDVPFHALTYTDGSFNLYNNHPDCAVWFSWFRLFYDVDGTAFWSFHSGTALSIGYNLSSPATNAWANYDILDKKGNVRIRESAPIPVADETVVKAGNKAMLLGCRLGRMIRRQLGGTSAPYGALASSDGYRLQDAKGLYLIAKEDA